MQHFSEINNYPGLVYSIRKIPLCQMHSLCSNRSRVFTLLRSFAGDGCGAPGDGRGLIEGSLGEPMDTTFRNFDSKCLGAASIGQVHRATLKDGREAVVKVPCVKRARVF